MSTTTTVGSTEGAGSWPDDHGRPTFSSLLSAEWLRLRSRRLVKVVLASALALLAFLTVIIAVNAGTPSQADLARAEQQAAADTAACLEASSTDPNFPKDVSPQEACGTADPTAYLTKQPFDFADEYSDGVTGIALAAALILFLIGASAGGAEWSARTMPALLYWEPRRVRVMAAKLAVLAGFAVLVSIAGQLLWLVMATGLSAARGSDPAVALPQDLLASTLGTTARGLLLAILIAWAGFALANLTRNTGAALGIAFVYFAVVENVVGGLLPRFLRWQVATNAIALLNPDGLEVPSGVSQPPQVLGTDGAAETFVLVSNLRGGIVLTVVVVVCLAIATVLFTRRDIT